MADPTPFLNRELSWLAVNHRVLQEALDHRNPPLERLRFLAIYSSNLDEFFMVRVAGLRRQAEANPTATDPAGLTASQQLALIRNQVRRGTARQYACLTTEIIPALGRHNVALRPPDAWTPAARREMKRYFENQILPVLTPVAMRGRTAFPRLSHRAIHLLVSLRGNGTARPRHALLEIPPRLPRFVRMLDHSPIADNGHDYALCEDVIMANLQTLFPGCGPAAAVPFRITRDMDFAVDRDSAADLVDDLQQAIRLSRRRQPIRLEVPAAAPAWAAAWLRRRLDVGPELVYRPDGPLDLSRFADLAGLEERPGLCNDSWQPLPSPAIAPNLPVVASLAAAGAIALFHPYESFDPVVRLLQEAAEDPDVLAIKQTLYRVGADSPVVHALQAAAVNGKQVTVVVEVKARFDEERNIRWARQLEEAGAHVIYGIASCKVHAKALLIVRREDGQLRRYLHLSTGNYNHRTAKLYADIGYLTTDPALCSDATALFNLMTGYAELPAWESLAVAPYNLRETLHALIDTEIANARQPGGSGRLTAKMNSLQDLDMIRHLYAAAEAGVEINLVVRGLCCLDTGLGHGRIRVVSIVDRYLEHARVFRFHNGGTPRFFLSSADWMTRNLSHRIEILFPVADPQACKRLDWLLETQMNDARKARVMKPGGTYTDPPRASTKPGSQELTYRGFASLADPRPGLTDTQTPVLRSPRFHTPRTRPRTRSSDR